MIDDRERNKDSDCADFFSAFNVMIVPVYSSSILSWR